MPRQINGHAAEILLVEDNPGDARLTREALLDGKVRNTLHHVSDGEQAMEFLRQEGDYAGMPRPDIVLLDLNLPRKDGREVLAEMKADEKLRSIPVVVLTTSSADEDILRSYNLQASCFITKPVQFDKFVEMIREVESFWFTVVKLPEV